MINNNYHICNEYPSYDFYYIKKHTKIDLTIFIVTLHIKY